MNIKYIQIHSFSDADSFLDAIHPSSKLFSNSYSPGRWGFRGQANSNWLLIPSALRNNVALLEEPGNWVTTHNPDSELLQIELEIRTIAEFYRIANSIGLFIPNLLPENRLLLDRALFMDPWVQDWITNLELPYPSDDLLPLIAVAQHFGIPTRLLDWTESPYVATYFAVSSAARDFHSGLRKKGEQLCVWAIDLHTFLSHQELFRRSNKSNLGELVKVKVPSFGNQNLIAQKGFFLLYRCFPYDLHSTPVRNCITELISDEQSFRDIVLHKLLIDIVHSPRILRKLSNIGVNAASVFPDFNGVAQAMKEQSIWESKIHFLERFWKEEK